MSTIKSGRIATMMIVILAANCSSPIDPTPKSPMEYRWSVSWLTAANQTQTLMRNIWGSSSSDVWVVGFSSFGGGYGGVFHFDGKGWRSVNINVGKGLGNLGDVIGFEPGRPWIAASEIWFTTDTMDLIKDSAVVLMYDGASWKSRLPRYFGASSLSSVWGTGPQNIYVGSANGYVLHYDGVNWTPQLIHPRLFIGAMSGANGTVMAVGTTISGNLEADTSMWFVLENHTWLRKGFQRRNTPTPTFGSDDLLCVGPNGTFFGAGGNGVFKLVGDQWISVLSQEGQIWGLGGTNDSHVFAVGTLYGGGATLHFFDGAKWILLQEALKGLPPDSYLVDVWCTDSEVFVVGIAGSSSFVLRGAG